MEGGREASCRILEEERNHVVNVIDESVHPYILEP
jgi:hypothetical protein